MDMFEYYGLFREEHAIDRLTETETTIINHLFKKYLPESGKVLDTSAGSGTFAFDFAEKGYEVTVGDLIAEHVEEIKANPKSSMLKEIYCASPRNLSRFEDETFDIVICMGSMYHTKTKAEREQIVREALRVLKSDGVFAFTFMTPMAMTLGQYFKAMRTYDNRDKLKAYRKLATVEKTHECDMFYGLTLDDMADLAREIGMDVLTIASTYGLLYNMVDEIAKMNDEEYAKFVEGQIATCEDAFIARYSMRGIFIGRKKQIDIFD